MYSANATAARLVTVYGPDPICIRRPAAEAVEQREVASAEALEGLHQHMVRTLVEIGFADPQQSKKLMRRLRRLFNRARPDSDELNILRGILTTAQNLVQRR